MGDKGSGVMPTTVVNMYRKLIARPPVVSDSPVAPSIDDAIPKLFYDTITAIHPTNKGEVITRKYLTSTGDLLTTNLL